MEIKAFQIDTFSNKVFNGISVTVVVLERWIDENILKNIASRSDGTVTVFIVDDGRDINVRYFTMGIEIPLCGHGVLAAGFVLKNHYSYPNNRLYFHNKSGKIEIIFQDKNVSLLLPAKENKQSVLTAELLQKFGNSNIEFIGETEDLFVVLKDEKSFSSFDPSEILVNSNNYKGVIVSSVFDNYDFTAKYFRNTHKMAEDFITGTALCSLVPYWSKKLGKNTLIARQTAMNIQDILCNNFENTVCVTGQGVTYMECLIKL